MIEEVESEQQSKTNKEDCDFNQDSKNSNLIKLKFPVSEILPNDNVLDNVLNNNIDKVQDNDNINIIKNNINNINNIKSNIDLLNDEFINEINTYPSPLKKLSQNILIKKDKNLIKNNNNNNNNNNNTLHQIEIFKDIKSKIAKSSSKFLSMTENAHEANNLNTLLIDKYNNQTDSLNESDFDSDALVEENLEKTVKIDKIDKIIKSGISSMRSSKKSSRQSSRKFFNHNSLKLKKNDNTSKDSISGDIETNNNFDNSKISKNSSVNSSENNGTESMNNSNTSTFEFQFKKYYMGTNENVSGLYDLYVTNCIKLITYIDSIDYFMPKIEEIKQSIQSINNKKLEFSQDKPLLILDLDETLIHSDLEMKFEKHDKYLEISTGVIPLNIRPHIYDFLDYCLEYFEIAIYTASCSDYADPIIDYIENEKGKKYFKYRFYREHCIYYKSLFLKDLSIFGKPMSQIIIIDNCLFSFAHYLDNGVLITSYYEDEEDLDLLSIIEFLKSSILESTDVRYVIKNTFEFSSMFKNLKNMEYSSS